MGKDLRYFLQLAKEAGPSFYVEAQKLLSSKLEVCVIQQKLAKAGRFPVLLCPKIKESKLPLVTNLFGSWELQGMALDVSPETMRKLGQIELFHEFRRRAASAKPTQVIPASEAPIKEIVLLGQDADLDLLPIPHHAESDSGRYITVGNLVCVDPDTKVPNVGVYRHEVHGKHQLGCAIGTGQHANYILKRYAELNRPMEVVVFVGHHPAVIMASNTKGSLDMNEFELAGALLGEPLQVTPGETVDLPVPAFAEIVIEGTINPHRVGRDGPFAEYTGYYGSEYPCNEIEVTAITMRKDAVYHDLDPAHQEHNLLARGLGRESNIYDVVKRAVPTVKAVHGGTAGLAGHPMVYISVKKQFEGVGKLAGLAALSADPTCNVAVVVDEDVDVYNEQEVLWAIATRVRADQDITIIPGVLGSILDPCTYDEAGRLKNTEGTMGSMATKMIIDATKPLKLPFATRITPPKDLWDSMRLEDYVIP